MIEKRKNKRRNFLFYMRVMDSLTQKPIGHLSNVSKTGFKVESTEPLPVGVHYNLRLALPLEAADKNFLILMARSRWCETNKSDPFSRGIGFEIVGMTAQDAAIYNRVIEKYAS